MDKQETDSSNYHDTFEKIRDELREKFNCFICLDLATDPVVIPCCGQIVCSKCLSNWLSSNNGKTCPYCRQEITITKGIPIKWAEKLKKFLQISVQNCPTHHKTYEFYCKTCSCYLCSDCLFEELRQTTSKHKSHSIIKFSEMLSNYKIHIKNELLEIIPHMTKVENTLIEVYEQNKALTAAKNSVIVDMIKKFNEINSNTEKQYEIYEKQIDEAIEQVKNVKQSINDEIKKIEAIINERQYFQNPQKTISASIYQSHLETFQKITKKLPNFESLLSAPDSNDLIIQFNNFSVYIPNFKEKNEQYKNLPENAIHFFYSQKVKLNGNVWRVKIYPNGNLNGEGTHLSVFLELIRGSGNLSTYSYKLLIKNRSDPTNPSLLLPDIQREYTSQFAETDSWGWNKAALLETLFNGHYLDEKGGLCIIFSIKPESYYQINLDYEHAIKRKKEKLSKLKECLKELESNEIKNDLEDYDNSFSQEEETVIGSKNKV